MTRTSLADLQRAAEAGAKAAAALLPRPTDRGAVQAFGTRMTSYLRRRKSRRAATPAPEPTSQLTRMLLEYEALTANAPPPRKALAEALYDVSSEYTRAQAREVARTVREGYDNDKGVEKVAAELKRRLGLEDAQANVLAVTEMTRVAALDQLDRAIKAGSDEVMFVSHEDACPRCEALHGKVFPLKRAHDVLPVHPNCKCRFQPVESTHNVFCPTGEGGGIDPTCSPKNKHSALSLSSEVAAVKSAARLSQKHLIFGSFTKTHPETRKQVISVLERLADQYGMPPGGIHIVEMSGGSTNHRASMGEKTWVRVSKEESARLKAEGLKTQLVPGSKGGFVHQVEDPTALRLSLYTNGTKDQAGFNQDPGQYTSIRNRKGNNVNTGRSGIEDTIVHEFGHALAFRAVGPEGVKRLGEEKADAELARSVSRYAATDKSELMAEAFVKYDAGSRDDRLVDLLRPYLPSAEKSTHNVFCPTGEGGGIDPTCSPGGGGSGKMIMTGDEVMGLIKSSPQFKDREVDWDRYQERYKIKGEFVEAEVDPQVVKKLIDSQWLSLVQAKNISEEDVASKQKTGKRNPVVISERSGGQMLVVDGNHSLVASLRSGDKNLRVIVPKNRRSDFKIPVD